MAAPRRRYHHGDLERALVAAARDLVERDGAGRFSVAEACKTAGVSTAAPYRHFRDKDDILAHVKMAGFRDLTDRMIAARDGATAAPPHGASEGPPATAGPLDAADERAVARVAGIGKAYVAFALRWPETFALMFGARRLAMSDAREREVRAAGETCFGVLLDEVARFLGRPADERESRELATMLWSFVHGLAGLARDGHVEAARVPQETERIVDRATRAVFAGLRGLSAAAATVPGRPDG